MPDAGSTPTENADLARFGYQQELKRGLSLKHLLVYGLVFMVPIAPFSIFGGVFDASHGMVPLTYLIGFVAMIFTAVSYQQMSRAFPIAGSVYSYAGRGISPSVGFLAGWSILLDYLLIPTLLYVIGANAMANVFPSIPQPVWIVAFVLVNTVVNLRGIEATAKANNVFLVGQLIVLGVFVGFAAWAISGGVNGASWTTLPFYNPAEFSAPLVFTALSVAVLSFLGFDAISTLSEETVGGNRVVGRATVVALCIVAALFVLQTYLAALLEPGITAFPTTEASNNAFYDIGRMIAGPWLQVVIALAVAIGSAVANSLVAQSATSRLLFSMARDGKLPAFLKVIHPETRIPQRAILLVAGLSLALGLFFVGQINLLASLCNFGALTAFLLLHVSVVVHHVVRQRSRRFGVHLLVPVIGFLVIGYVLVNADVNAKVGGLTWIVVGLVIIAVFKVTGRSTELRASDAPLDAADLTPR